MVYVGVDLHHKRSHVVALDEKGEVLASKRIDNEPEEFFRIFGELTPAPIEVAFEATYGWAWFADLLSDAGIEAHMAHPLGTKAISSARVKNDAVDAKTLAHLLRTKLLPEAWMAPPEIREARRLVRSRVSLTRIRSRLKCQVHVILADFRISSPVSDLFGVGGRAFLESLELPEIPSNRLAALLHLIDATTTQITAAESEMRALFRGDQRIQRLMAIPGIGFVSAATIATEIGDVTRFSSPDKLSSWAGLTPREHSSDAHTRRGHISKQGSRWLRWVLVEAAAHPGLKDPGLRRFKDRIESRRGRKVARVALAHRLLTLCFYALRDEGGCRAFPVTR